MPHDTVGRPPTGRHFPDLRVETGALGRATWVLSTRFGGCSVGAYAESNLADHLDDDPEAVRINRGAMAQALGAAAGLAVVRAEHGCDVAHVSTGGEVLGVDALTTDRHGLGLLALGADCAVVGLHGYGSDGSSHIAVVHSGWRGLIVDAVGAAVAQLRTVGADNIAAVVGPAICGTCYRVPQDRAASVREHCTKEVTDAAIVTNSTGLGLDIGAGVRARLRQLDVSVETMFSCTYEDDRWFSLRRSVEAGVPDGRTGRHGLGLVIT